MELDLILTKIVVVFCENIYRDRTAELLFPFPPPPIVNVPTTEEITNE
jgi:hypothetical protein